MIEQDIERVLRGLGAAEASRGLEERVLRAMETRQPVRRGFGLALIGVVALGVIGAVLGGLRYMDSINASIVANEEQRMAEGGMVAPVSSAYPHSHSQALPGEVVPAFRLNLTTRVRPLEPAREKHERHAASSEGRVEEVGFPAPAAPLTEQERLLLRLARRPNQGTIAMFDEGIREERAAAEKAEFDFLNPQRPIETEPPTDSTTIEEKQNDRSQSKR